MQFCKISIFLCAIFIEFSNSRRHAHIPRTEDGKPLSVKIGFYIESMGGLDPQRMAYDIDMYFRMTWRDPSKNHSKEIHIVKDLDTINQIWRPDLYFPNSRQASFHRVTMPNFVMFVEPDGSMSFSVRVTLTAACHMQLHHYPMDEQKCSLKIASYGYTDDRMNVTWFDESPIVLNPDIMLPEFSIIKIEPDYCDGLHNYSITHTKRRTGRFSCLVAHMQLHRSIGYHLVQTFIPTALIVIISFVSFWIDRSAVPARITLSFTTLLTITTQVAGVRYGLPPVSYAKAVDFWLGACLIFVFAGLLEYAFVNSYMRISQRYAKIPSDQRRRRSLIRRTKSKNEEHVELAEDKEPDTQASAKYSLKALQIDQISRIVFPLLFLIFVTVYWIYYSFV